MFSKIWISSLFILDIYKLIKNELFDLHWCSTLKNLVLQLIMSIMLMMSGP
jgi:hypothetical protein